MNEKSVSGAHTTPPQQQQHTTQSHVPINMSVMPIRSLVFNMRRINGNFPSLFFGGPVNLFVRQGLTPTLGTQHLGNGLGQGRLAMIDVSNGTNIDVGFVATEHFGGKRPALL